MIEFTGERIVPQATNCEPMFTKKMFQIPYLTVL